MKAMWGPGPVSFDGKYYQLRDLDVLPKPAQGRPWLLIGGSGPKRTLRYVAEYADEWNTPNAPLETLAERIKISWTRTARPSDGTRRRSGSR